MRLKTELDFTIDTDEQGDFISFYDGREAIRGDKAIIRYMYDRLRRHSQAVAERERLARIDQTHIIAGRLVRAFGGANQYTHLVLDEAIRLEALSPAKEETE